jgi:hypothetical protein
VRQYVSDIVGFLEPEETEDEEYKITTVKVVDVDGAKIEDGPVVYDARNNGSLTDACDVAADIVLALGGLGPNAPSKDDLTLAIRLAVEAKAAETKVAA